MWKIKHIFDGEYGCEGRLPGQLPQVSVTLTDEKGNERYVSAEDAWLTEQGLEVGDHWPCETSIRSDQEDRTQVSVRVLNSCESSR